MPGEMHQAIVLWFHEKFIRGLIDPHVELRPIDRLLKESSRALTFSEPTRAKAQTLVCELLHQEPAARLISLLKILLILSADAHSAPLTSASSQAGELPSANEERIGRVISYLHQHYREEISIPRLMRMAALSRSSLHRLFRLQTSMTIGDYVARLRIGNACALLMDSTQPIALIADAVGYSSLGNFNRQFKALKTQTPREFRTAFTR